MRATVMYGAGDVRVEDVPDAHLIEPTDALVVVSRAAICGSDLWPYQEMEPKEVGRRMGHEFIGVVDAVGDEVCTLSPGDLVVAPFLWSTAPVSSAGKGCTPPACTEAGTAPTTSTAARARPCASPRLTARSSSCRSLRTTH